MTSCRYCENTTRCRYCSGTGAESGKKVQSIDDFVECHRCMGTAKCEWCAGKSKGGARSRSDFGRREGL